MATLSRVFRVPASDIQSALLTARSHDWSTDPFAQGAYSYTPVGMIQMAATLAEPVEQTLLFAGEATNAEGEQGTVQAALASGRRAATEILM